MPIEYDSYTFDTTPNWDLDTLVLEYDDIFTYYDSLEPVRGAWTLEKPVSKLEISPDPSHDRVTAFLNKFSTYFYWEFNGFGLFFSRFPELAAFAAQCDTPARGVLFGYDLRDVAQYLVEKSPGAFFEGPDHLDGASDTDSGVRDKREESREVFAAEGLYEPADESTAD